MVARIGMAYSAVVASATKAGLEKWNIGIRGLINDPAHASNF
jgi:hypothetical protein